MEKGYLIHSETLQGVQVLGVRPNECLLNAGWVKSSPVILHAPHSGGALSIGAFPQMTKFFLQKVMS